MLDGVLCEPDQAKVALVLADAKVSVFLCTRIYTHPHTTHSHTCTHAHTIPSHVHTHQETYSDIIPADCSVNFLVIDQEWLFQSIIHKRCFPLETYALPFARKAPTITHQPKPQPSLPTHQQPKLHTPPQPQIHMSPQPPDFQIAKETDKVTISEIEEKQGKERTQAGTEDKREEERDERANQEEQIERSHLSRHQLGPDNSLEAPFLTLASAPLSLDFSQVHLPHLQQPSAQLQHMTGQDPEAIEKQGELPEAVQKKGEVENEEKVRELHEERGSENMVGHHCGPGRGKGPCPWPEQLPCELWAKVLSFLDETDLRKVCMCMRLRCASCVCLCEGADIHTYHMILNRHTYSCTSTHVHHRRAASVICGVLRPKVRLSSFFFYLSISRSFSCFGSICTHALFVIWLITHKHTYTYTEGRLWHSLALATHRQSAHHYQHGWLTEEAHEGAVEEEKEEEGTEMMEDMHNNSEDAEAEETTIRDKKFLLPLPQRARSSHRRITISDYSGFRSYLTACRFVCIVCEFVCLCVAVYCACVTCAVHGFCVQFVRLD